MSTPILIRGARQLITLHGHPLPRHGAALRDLGIITDGAVLIRDGRIEEVGASRRVEALAEARDAQEINAAGRIVLPGFVDCNTHIVTGGSPAFETSADQACTSIQQTPPRILERQGLRLLEDFVRYGTTTVEAKSGLGMSERNELKILRVHAALNRRTCMLGSTFTAAHWPASNQLPDDQIDYVCSNTLPAIKLKRLAQIAEIDCEYFTIQQVRQYLSVARQLGFVTKIQAGERAYSGAIADALRLGVAGVEHANAVTSDEVSLLAGSGVIATLLPGPVFFGGDRNYPPARTLIDGGAAVALATNCNPYTTPSHNMQMIIALACRKMSMTIAEAIAAATVNGAYAMRRSDIGSIERGKIADLIMLAVADHREIPCHFGVNMVEMTMRRGQVVYHRPDIRWPATQ